ncbi:S-adenosyl-L-methionine-dependent methyltransferase [Mycena venus]|uniref:S-adenosyl-L-methionine-dependent methyltransferase n=1 Tax=Mycena venus TaxID=2733690 RepID=A0A8H7D536_9AGAR|nr:S-adenosyl-L-methionine-dependent methyltransferase [Mycena venus]
MLLLGVRSRLDLATTTQLYRLLPVRLARRSLHPQPKYVAGPFVGLSHLKRRMAETPSVGEVRAPSPPSDAPAAKKPRLQAHKGAPASDKARSLSKSQKRRAQYNSLPEPCSADDVLWREINDVLGEDYVNNALAEGTDRQSPFVYHQELELQVVALCSTGSALATSSESSRPWVVVVPFSLPGETIRAKVYRNARMHSFADLIEVVAPNPELRDDSLVQCKYFATCGGCQYQMLSYEKQLDLKRDVVVKAYKNYSNLPETAIPAIESTMPSPKQYNYRTKITPHFEAPTKAQRVDPNNPANDTEQPKWLNIGFNRVGTHKVMDIEDCPIATPIIRETLPAVRANVVKNLYTYKRGVSLILRDSLPPVASATAEGAADTVSTEPETHVCITDHRGTVREKIGSWVFEYPNSSFFQNNNSVLPSLTDYVQSSIFGEPTDGRPKPTHLVDAYCGAGLFAITLSPHFTTVAGIELSQESIRAAKHNAELNYIPATKISFRAGDAADIFRTGCDEPFIKQLLAFRAQTVVYVSCNVHTQARDVGMVLKGSGEDGRGKYVLESLRGFDLFPQTAHVESVAVLRLVQEAS